MIRVAIRHAIVSQIEQSEHKHLLRNWIEMELKSSYYFALCGHDIISKHFCKSELSLKLIFKKIKSLTVSSLQFLRRQASVIRMVLFGWVDHCDFAEDVMLLPLNSTLMIVKSDHLIVVMIIMSKAHVPETFDTSLINHYDMLCITMELPFSLLSCITISFPHNPRWE